MVKYYGRARQRTGSVNTKQLGLKMAGISPTIGKKGVLLRYTKSRVRGGPGSTACGLSGNGYTCRFGVRGNMGSLAVSKYCKKQNTPCIKVASRSASRAGGVGNIWTPRGN